MKPRLRTPPFARLVMVCGSCSHWQVDMPPRAVRELGHAGVSLAAVEAAAAHDCPGAGGRIKVLGKWVDPPPMSSGEPADGTLVGHILPAWWVWK